MSEQLIKYLIPLLPRFSEEEGDFHTVKRDDLITDLVKQSGVENAVAENTVMLCENLLTSLATLDRYYLQQGDWRFISFPAQLMATSVLSGLSDPDAQFFPAKFWNTQGISAAKKEQQRAENKTAEDSDLDNYKKAIHKEAQALGIRSLLSCIAGEVMFMERLRTTF